MTEGLHAAVLCTYMSQRRLLDSAVTELFDTDQVRLMLVLQSLNSSQATDTKVCAGDCADTGQLSGARG